MTIKGYRDLLVWQKAAEMAKEVYIITRKFPRHERFGLISQLQRAAVSVASNIAEGQARWHTTEFRQFLYHALGSLAEVDTQLYLAQEFGYVHRSDVSRADTLIEQVRKMVYTLSSRLPGAERGRRRPRGSD